MNKLPGTGAIVHVAACDQSLLAMLPMPVADGYEVATQPVLHYPHSRWRLEDHPTTPGGYVFWWLGRERAVLRSRFTSELLAEYLDHEPVVCGPAGNKGAEVWRLDRGDSGRFRIVHRASGLILSLAGKGPGVILAPDEGYANQRWQIVRAD
jgi:hypothetical protein